MPQKKLKRIEGNKKILQMISPTSVAPSYDFVEEAEEHKHNRPKFPEKWLQNHHWLRYDPGFEIPIHLLAKCKLELETASQIFKHLQKKNARANNRLSITQTQ